MAKLYTDNEIETILRSYPRLKSQASIEEEKLFGLFPSVTASYDGMPHSTGISNQTANLGVKRASIPQTSRQVRAIELAYNALTSECKELVDLYYYQRLKKYEVQTKMCISDQQFRCRKYDALEVINEILSTTKEQENNSILTNCG
jgi:DNA-directed RNA polymerase specialized sigma24 family protein